MQRIVATATYPSHEASAARARRFLKRVLERIEATEAERAALLIGELAANAVVHAFGDVKVCLRVDESVLRVEVLDSSTRRPQPRDVGWDSEGGRGLLLVEHLADAWGYELHEDGKATWFEVALGSEALAA